MHCPRLDHFAKILPHDQKENQTAVMNCCVMTDAPLFDSYDEMMRSKWLSTTKQLFSNNRWPAECVRCKEQEDIGLKSDRLQWIDYHQYLLVDHGADYLMVSMMLDNVCNTACQFCSPYISSKLASLQIVPLKIRQVGSYEEKLPLNRITQIDLEGGEPSNSKNVKNLLVNLPQRVKTVKIYTNARSFLDELVPVAERGIEIQISISLDGVGPVQEYVRWPTQWDEFCHTLEQYKKLQEQFPELVSLCFKTTLCALNVFDVSNIIAFADQHKIVHSMSQLAYPAVLHIAARNNYTVAAKEKLSMSGNEILKKLAVGIAVNKVNQQAIDEFIAKQDQLRHISIEDYVSIQFPVQ